MLKLKDYTILETIGEGLRSIIYKGFRDTNPDCALCIKSFKSFQITNSEKKYYLQKIEHLKILGNNDDFLIPLEFSHSSDSCFIVRKYFKGLPLDKYLEETGKLDLVNFLNIAIVLCNLIEMIHQAGIIHGNIKPHNILIDPSTLKMKIVDFVSALDVRSISHFIYDQQFVQSTLAYTSPEQTGRINYRVDFTTDIYSLGIIFYKMLTGELPYFSEDPLEMIHFHMAKIAVPVDHINLKIPHVISDIILKMIGKRPEQRYQTAHGISLDLVKCQKQIMEGVSSKKISFYLGEKDHHTRIKFISKMVGRDNEAVKILDCYDQVASGSFRSMFISGFSGIGKTRLIQELQRPIIKRRGYFTSGKFDVYQKNIPYSSLLQAFRSLVKTFLTESDSRVFKWKEKILKAVEGQGQVLVEVIPELEILLGVQSRLDALPPVEARNRFNRVFESFLNSIASSENPLVLFIDDLQWCDLASFEFLTNVFNNSKENGHLFFIGAYRHNEVDSDHPLLQLLNKIKKEKYPIEEIFLDSVSEEACNDMVSYILDVPSVQTVKLASFLSHLTNGNPLFISESLSYLYNEKVIRYVENKNEWSWDLENINQTAMPTTIVDLFSSKLKKLNPSVIILMEYCACMGNYFEPDDLAKIVGIKVIELFEVLKPALSQSLIIENKNQLQFVHDKVQEAALAGIPLEQREVIHWKIGNYFFDEANGDFKKLSVESIFSIASHFNLAVEIGLKSNKKLTKFQALLICEVNFHAGNSALDSLATYAANDYFNKALNLLSEKCWESNYELTYQLHIKLAKTELMVGRYETSEKLLTDLLNNAKSNLDKIEALAEQTTSLSSIGNFIKAIETANKGLSYFEMDISENAEIAQAKCDRIMAEIHGDHDHGGNIDVWTKILTIPFSDDRKSKVELSFYSELIPDLYMSGMPEQLYLAAAQSTQNCLSGGMNESVIYSFSIMGLNLGEKECFDKAFKYEDLAINMVEKYPNTFGATRGINGVVWCNMHSRSTPDMIIDYCFKGIQSGKNCGDLYNAGLCYGPLMWNLQIKGNDFEKIKLISDECWNFSKKFNLNFSIGLAESVIAGWVNPMMASANTVDIDEKIKKWKNENHIASIGSYYTHMGLSYYYLNKNEQAKECFLEVEKYLNGMTDNVLKRQWTIFKALNQIELFLQNPTKNSKKDLIELNENISLVVEKTEKWVSLGPLLKPFFKFLLAKISHLNNGFEKSINLYFEAVSVSSEMEYIFFEGFINESIGTEFYNRHMKSSKRFIQEALELYRNCSAQAKIADLENKFEDVNNNYLQNAKVVDGIDKNFAKDKNEKLRNFDLEYFLKASAIISTEVNIDVLVKKIIDVVLESSGAQLGLLIAMKDNNLVALAKNDLNKQITSLDTDYLLEKDLDVCHAVIRYVYRSQQEIILENALQSGEFVNDLDVQRLKLKSILCLPLLSQSKIIGVIYLENRLMNGVFQSKQIRLTKLLSLQAAIGIENALLLENVIFAKNEIKASLAEKEILLKEVHHRVKNNLQIIYSLFNIQIRKINDEKTTEIFKEAQNRIYSISLIHEKLFQSNSYSKINFKDYIEGLILNMVRSYETNSKKDNLIKFAIEVAEVDVPLDVAVPLGLIINEIITNIFKYAFQGKEGEKEVQIQLFCQKNYDELAELRIEDNGVGFLANLDHKKTNGIGMTLIKNLSTQIRASFTCTSDHGVKYCFFIPLNNKGD